MHFTLKQLQIFVTTANHLSISQAAKTLHLSQPAISQQIRKIEKYSGKQLFEQFGRKIYLTEHGKRLLEYAEKTIEQAKIFKLACTSNSLSLSGQLRLSINIPLQGIFFKTLNKFINQYPLISLKILDGTRNAQLQFLKENKIDFCLTVQAVDHINLICEKLTDLPMVFIISPQHRLASNKSITLQALYDETFIICEENSANYLILKKLFNKINNNSPKIIQLQDQNAIKHAVISNLGISVLPIFMLALEIKNKLIMPIVINNFETPMTGAYWIQHANKELPSVAQLFKTFLHNEFKKYNDICYKSDNCQILI